MTENGEETQRMIAGGRAWPNCDTDDALMRAILILSVLLLVGLVLGVFVR